jgi:adenosine kinase
MKEASASKISFIQEDIALAIVSANHIPTMLEHARALHHKDIRFFIDPAQQISQMTHDEIRELIDLADYLIVNHHEFRELQALS